MALVPPVLADAGLDIREDSVKFTADPSAVIDRVSVSFFTHNDNKDFDTSVSVFVVNPINIFLSQLIAKKDGADGDLEYKDNPPSTHEFDLDLVSTNISLAQLTFPTYTVRIAPTGHDRWIFDVTVRLHTSDGSEFASTDMGIVLDQDNRVHSGQFHA
jgi:hypothetical protein